LASSNNWEDFQTRLARIGIETKPRSSGAVFADLNSNFAIKGSALVKDFSFKR
jgi:hypothetical protein